MQKKIKAYLRNPDKSPSLDNLDFESSVYLRRIEEKGHKFEFGECMRGDGSVEITVELPNPIPVPESPEEWAEKRKWYLEHAGNCAKTLRRGICEGYLIETGLQFDEICGDMINAAEVMQNEEYLEEGYDYLLWEFEQEKRPRTIKRSVPNPKAFLQEGKGATYNLIEKAKRLRNNMMEGKPWTNEEFQKIGFKLPEFSNPAESGVYVLSTLEDFLQVAAKRNRQIPNRLLRDLIRASGLDISLVHEAKDNPWGVYEVLKQNYCSKADSIREYDRRIDEVVFALRV